MNKGKPLNKKFKGFFYFLIVFFSAKSVSAQVNFVDSIRYSLTKKPKLIGTISSHNTFIDGLNSPIYNIKGGFSFNNNFRTGLGYAFLSSPYTVDKIIGSSPQNILVPAQLKFGYINFFAEYVFYKTKRWEVSVPLFLGIGSSYLKYNYNNQSFRDDKHLVLLYEPVISVEYDIFSWFGVGGDVGYRLMLVNNRSINNRFNSPVYSFGSIIFFSTLWDRFVKEMKKHPL